MDQAYNLEYLKSSNYKSLNGIWKFHLSKNPSNKVEEFYMDDFDVSLWDNIEVPGNS